MTARDPNAPAEGETDELALETLDDLDVTADDVVRGGGYIRTGKPCEYAGNTNDPRS
jgi:hypothetical protein